MYPYFFMDVSKWLRFAMAKSTGLDPEQMKIECPGNTFDRADDIQSHLRNLFYRFIAGYHM